MSLNRRYNLFGAKMIRNKICCSICKREISKSNFSKHKCKETSFLDRLEKISEDIFQCPKCNFKGNSFSIRSHYFGKHIRDYQNNPTGKVKGCKAWNKGLDKLTDERVAKNSESLRITLNNRTEFEKAQFRLKQQEQVSKRNGPKSKGAWVKDSFGKEVYLQSTFESFIANYLDLHGIKWIRPSYFIYVDDLNIKRRYFPDFYLPSKNLYLDPKNAWLANGPHKRKIELVKNQVLPNLEIITGEQLNSTYLDKLLEVE